MADLEEVAKRARVSTATVSRVINETGLVKPSTRARVMKAIAELNYYPNLHARTLAGGKSRTIGMIVSNLENPFFLDIFRAVEKLAHAARYEVVVANTGYEPSRLVKSIRLMIGRRVAGLAAIVSEMDPALIDELSRSGLPVVFYDVGVPRPNITNIRVNYRSGIEHTVRYLHDLGHRRIGFAGHHSSLAPLHDRMQSLIDMVQRYGPTLSVSRAAGSDSFAGGRSAARELLESGFDPTAIMCVNDFMAVGVVRELRLRGIRVPDDVSVTGFDNIELAEYCSPPLTTVDIPRQLIGDMVFHSLAGDARESANTGRELLVDPTLIVRESTAPAAGRSSNAAMRVLR
jgi:DNA-binding LacI/PurR family transcriptional regulator